MRDFNTLSTSNKKLQHEKFLASANNFGGKNFFLQLLEEIRDHKTHPLLETNNAFHIDLGSISWNKSIFKSTLDLLIKARINEGKQGNLLPKKDEKNHKKVLNVIRTMKPIVFHVKPANPKDGSGFFFQAFDIIDEKTTLLNPIFDALFFSSIESVKKVLNYKVEKD